MKNSLIVISLLAIGLFLPASCATTGGRDNRAIRKDDAPDNRAIRKDDVIEEKRPFQRKKFAADAWRAGDVHARGEMADDLNYPSERANAFDLRNKTQPQILETLGEPDRKTRGRCCGGRNDTGGDDGTKEVWLYNVEVRSEDGNIKTKQFQIYFDTDNTADVWRIDEWDDSDPDYFPRVG